MNADPIELAARIDAAVAALPGVATLYFAAPLPARLWRTATARETTYANVTSSATQTQVVVSIGVEHDRADAVARLVGKCVRDVLGEPDAQVTVRVSRISTV